MKISTRAEYGIRVLVALARADGSGPLPLATVARVEKLPHAYLEQLVGDLRRAGLVTATRGKAGGYRLARPAAQISMVDAVRALDGPLLEMPCAGPDNLEAFQRVYEALQGTLGAATLAEAAIEAGGPPYPPAVRKRNAAAHAAMAGRTSRTTSPTTRSQATNA
jgi:Rrf2 family protein